MKIEVIGKKLEITNSLYSYIEKKFKHLKFPENTQVIHIKLSIPSKSEHLAEISYHSNDKDLHISSSEDDLYHSIDSLADKTKRSITKIKETKKIHLH